MFVVFDLDGTLALHEHRKHFLEKTPKDWEGFHIAAINDAPNIPLIETMGAFIDRSDRVEIWTGRWEKGRKDTETWLYNQGIFPPAIHLQMRPTDDYREDVVLKKEWFLRTPMKPDLVFEDRTRMVQMWRQLGVVCCQVAPGDF